MSEEKSSGREEKSSGREEKSSGRGEEFSSKSNNPTPRVGNKEKTYIYVGVCMYSHIYVCMQGKGCTGNNPKP